jgi:hypothetical protein
VASPETIRVWPAFAERDDVLSKGRESLPVLFNELGSRAARFAHDSPLEESGFEPLVPPAPKRKRCRRDDQ